MIRSIAETAAALRVSALTPKPATPPSSAAANEEPEIAASSVRRDDPR